MSIPAGARGNAPMLMFGVTRREHRATFRSLPVYQPYPYAITGVTRDSSGNILGGCIVKLFYTSNDVEAATVLSDSTTGAYTFLVGPSLACYVVAYKAGSPDVAGTTVNTLIATAGVSVPTVSTLLSGLQVYYQLEDLTDESGSGMTLTDHGTVTFTAGKVSNAANFVSASTQYLTHADAAPFQIGTGDLTLALWIKMTISTNVVIADYGVAGGSAGYGVNANGSGFQGYISDGTLASCGDVNNFNNGIWHLCIVTFNRSGNMQMYVDNATEGAAVDITPRSGSVNSSHGFSIGANYLGGSLFDGSVDEFGLWNRVLTSTEIGNLWNGGAGTTYPFTGL